MGPLGSLRRGVTSLARRGKRVSEERFGVTVERSPTAAHAYVPTGGRCFQRRAERCACTPGRLVIPCYNRAHFLAEAIGSALDQTHRSLEVVVGHGSADETPKVTLRYRDVRLVRQDNWDIATKETLKVPAMWALALVKSLAFIALEKAAPDGGVEKVFSAQQQNQCVEIPGEDDAENEDRTG